MENTIKTISKTDDELRVGNYIVMYGGRDLTPYPNKDGTRGEYFSPRTQLESDYTKTGVLHVDFEHGQDPDGLGITSDNVLGYVDWKTAKIDEHGVFVERVLNRRNKYMQYLETLIDEGLVGNSSECISGGSRRSIDGEILEWRLKRDTLTVMPAEPRMLTENAISAMKSLNIVMPQEKQADAQDECEPVKPVQIQVIETKGAIKMTEETKPSELQALETRMDAKSAALSDKLDALLKHIQDAPALRGSGYVSQDGGRADANVKSFGDFLTAIQRGDEKRLREVYKAVHSIDEKTLGESNGNSSAILVPEEYNANLYRVAYETSPVLNMVTKVPVGTKSGTYPALDVTVTPTAGVGQTSLAAGVKSAKRGEAAAYVETEPAFYEIKWDVNDFASGYTQTTKELRADSPQAIETLLTSLFGIAVASKIEYGIFRGTGIGEPLGILNAPAKLGVTPVTNSLFAYKDAMTMASKFKKLGGNSAWFYHPSILPDFTDAAWAQGNNVMTLGEMGWGGTFVSEHLPQADNAGCVLLADFSAYLLFLRGTLEISYSEHYGFINGKDTWRFSQRADGQPWLKAPITLADPQGSYQVSPFVYFND